MDFFFFFFVSPPSPFFPPKYASTRSTGCYTRRRRSVKRYPAGPRRGLFVFRSRYDAVGYEVIDFRAETVRRGWVPVPPTTRVRRVQRRAVVRKENSLNTRCMIRTRIAGPNRISKTIYYLWPEKGRGDGHPSKCLSTRAEGPSPETRRWT